MFPNAIQILLQGVRGGREPRSPLTQHPGSGGLAGSRMCCFGGCFPKGLSTLQWLQACTGHQQLLHVLFLRLQPRSSKRLCCTKYPTQTLSAAETQTPASIWESSPSSAWPVMLEGLRDIVHTHTHTHARAHTHTPRSPAIPGMGKATGSNINSAFPGFGRFLA